MKILYVEDNSQDVDLTQRALKGSAPKIRLDVAVSLEKARRQLTDVADYDLVLLDLRLPDGSGLELLSEIQAQSLPIVVVILTGSGDEETAVAALKAGAHDYLVKRADYLERLPDVLERAMARFKDVAARRVHPLRVVYVERHKADIDLTRRHLARYAPHIQLELLNIEEVLQRLPQTPEQPCFCDVLLLDYQLPGLNALEALKIIRYERGLDVPIILVTGQGNEEIASQALRLGASDYLVKHSRYLFELPAALENAYHRTRAARKQAALLASEARFRRLAENARDVIFHVSLVPEIKIEYISPAVTALTGYVPEEFEANPDIVAEIVNLGEDLAKLTGLTGAQTDDESLISIRLTHKDGRLVWVEINPVFVQDEDGRTIALEGIARDITVNKEAEETLRLQSAALNTAANAMVITNEKAEIQWINPAFTALTGYTLAEAVGQPMIKLVRSEMHHQAFYQEMRDKLLGGQVWHGEIINRDKHGNLYTEEQTITPLFDEKGAITHFVAIKQNVTSRRETEADRVRLLTQMREQAQRVQQIIETVPEGVLLLDASGQVILANPVAERDLVILAQTNEADAIIALGGRPLADLLAPPPSGFWHEIEQDGRTFEAIARLLGNDMNSDNALDDNAKGNNAASESGQPKHWVMVINDVTDARAHRRYQQAQDRLAMVGQLAAGIAHDFNNVMGVISLYSELIQKTGDLSPKGLKQAAIIYKQARHASKLIEQILDFSRSSVMELTTIDLLPIVKEMMRLLERTVPENIKLTLDYYENEYIVQADPTRLQQALMNLAVNARDAMPDGGQLKIALSTFELTSEQSLPLPDMSEGHWVRLVVTDTGSGIAEANLTRLFEPFFTTKAPGQGTGLGLAQVHGIVKQHGGSIDVESELGVGSAFTLFLPLLPQALAKAPSDIDVAALVGGMETILLVEDNRDMLASVADTLASLGYRVLAAASGFDALALLDEEETAVALILSDLIMPDMSGLELYQAIRNNNPLTKMMIMTGHPLDENAAEFSEDDAVGWIQKPFSVDRLAAQVRAALDGER